MKKPRTPWATGLLLLAAACSSPVPEQTGDDTPQPAAESAQPTPAEIERANAVELENAITLTGWRGIRLGEPPGGAANDWGFTDRGGMNETCHIWLSDGSRGMALMVEDLGDGPMVTRITARSELAADVHSTRGITVGASEAEVRAAYDGLEERPHKYNPAPAKDLIWQPNGSDTGLRFEISTDGRVARLHSGMGPSLRYVEGCS